MTDAEAVEVLQDLKAAVHDMPERLAAIERAIELLEKSASNAEYWAARPFIDPGPNPQDCLRTGES